MSWVAHTGATCPVDLNAMVEYQLDDGETRVARAGLIAWWDMPADEGRILRYRLLEPATTKPTNPKDAIGIRKAPLTTVPMNVIAEVGVAMLEGAAKYGRHNYRGVGVRTSVYVDATMRHIVDFWEGVDVDPDSSLHHITKAIASLVVLRDAQMQGKADDDRPPRSAPFYPALNAAAGAVLDRHADKTPHHYTQADDAS